MRRFLTYLLLSSVPANLALFADPNNILVNGGFEYGLMCYADFVLSSGSNPYGGNYQFSLSTDAHSGNYAIELSCSTGDCTGAVMGTNYIPSPPNQSYLLSFYAKCPAGASAAVATNLLPNNASLTLTCDGSWELNQLAFQTGTSTYFNVIFHSYNVSTLLLDDVVLTYGNGDVPDQPVMFPGLRNVSISGQTVEVDGAPFLSLGFFDVPYPDLALVAATGANTINALPNNNSANCINSSATRYLDLVYQLGMNFVPDSTTTAELQTPSVFPAVTQTFAPHLANIVWFLADEPDQSSVPWIYIPPSTFLAESVAAKTQTSLPMMADFQKAYYGVPTDVAPYNGSVDIWMSEPYGASFSDVNVAINNFNAVQLRPIWLAQDDIGPSLIVPKAYWAIIAGATGIHYFDWGTFKGDPPSLAAATQAFSELKALNNAIFGQKIDNLVTPPAGIASMSRFDPVAGISYILSANSGTQTVQGNFLVQGLTAGTPVTVLYENRTIAASAGSFSDTFAGVSRHVYAIQEYQLTTAASPAAGGTVTPASGYQDAGAVVSVQATANPGYRFANFSGGTLTGSTNPQNVTMNGSANVVANFTPLTPNLAASVGARTPSGSNVVVSLTLTNTGLGAATNASIASITAISDVAGAGTVTPALSAPLNLGAINPGSSATGAVTFAWPSTATRVSFTVNFTADGGYTGSSKISTIY